MCDHQWSVYIDSDSGQASGGSVNSCNKDVFVASLVASKTHELTILRALEWDSEGNEKTGQQKSC